MLVTARLKADKSQKYMAQAMGKSLSTIKNWETGVAVPNLANMLEWYSVLNQNPLAGFLTVAYPDKYKELSSSSESTEIRKALLHYLSEIATDEEIRKLSFCIFGNTGSSWHSQLDMLTAHNHCTMRSRVMNGWNIYNNYLMEEAREELINTEHIMPDMENFSDAINRGQQSAFMKINNY